jgi:dienelactone hydrolase
MSRGGKTRVIAAIAVLLSASACLLAEPVRTIDRFFGTASQPKTPVETLPATDLPLKRIQGDKTDADHLRPYDLQPQTFEYTLQLIAEEERFRLYRLVFPSPLNTPWPENNRVPAEFYVPRDAGASAKVPAAVILDIMDGSAILPRMMARAAAQQGVAALYLPMPCYNDRKPPNDEHKRVLREDPRRAADGFRQTVMDVRRAKAILASRPEVDANQVGITGISLGGIMTALAAGVDGEFARVVPILAGGDVAAITFHAHESRKLRAAMVEKGMDQAAAAEAFLAVEPLNFASRVAADRCLMINAADDEVIPKATTQALNDALGRPQLVWLPAGHYTALTYFPLMQKTVIDFLRDGTRPPSGEKARTENGR